MNSQLKTVFYDRHQALGASFVNFGGWEMPIQYPSGIMNEHMATRQKAGLFDVSHMGRLYFYGKGALSFLQHVLSNNASALEPGESQYTLIQNETGGALDDAYLYRFREDEYLLVVNASNREKDIAHFRSHLDAFENVEMKDKTFEKAMISIQGPDSKSILRQIVTGGQLPEPARNRLNIARINDTQVYIARTGYTGDPLGFELFADNADALWIWDLLIEKGACPVGLGARDTLRLEAGLPLYGHELGLDPEKKEIPVFASKLSRFAVSFSLLKGEFVGRQALLKQHEALKAILDRKAEITAVMPRIIKPVAVTGKGIAREGYRVFKHDRHVGYITSGTMIPYQETVGSGLSGKFKKDLDRRAIALALIDSDIQDGEVLEVEIRKKRCEGVVVPYHLSSEAPPVARSIPWDRLRVSETVNPGEDYQGLAGQLVQKAVKNHTWRQKECINLIPSEMSQSRLSRLLSISDPVNRYAEHKEVKAFSGEDVFYYQGTEFINEIENLLCREFQSYFGCRNVESRVISGQMANTAVFSALVDYINRFDRKQEPRRIRKILNNHIIRGGHLSAQPMGALRDFVARDPKTEKPSVVNFPVLADNPYKIDVAACETIIKEHQPELVIFGKSMIIHKEPVREIRQLVDQFAPGCLVLYDMAHVLGLYGPYFQEALKEGAHMVTGSTHKTYFGTQRGVIASDFGEEEKEYDLWEAVKRRTFPGSVSNHHLGTMVGLLFSAYEMNRFKDSYQKAVISNAKAFALALNDQGLDVAGDPEIDFTETHQVILNVGYGKGAQIAEKLEKNNVIVNYQATPEEEGFTASGALRMGVSEMTRFGMEQKDFQALAGLMADLILNDAAIRDEIIRLRKDFTQMQFCFDEKDLPGIDLDVLK